MVQIDLHIQKLLLEHDCLSIPGFGGLVAQHFGAEINPVTHVMRPPSRRFSFHADLRANEHLILQSLAQSENCSIDEARKVVHTAVQGWLRLLQQGDAVKVSGVGRFYLDNSGSISFNQSLESSFELGAFGYDIFRISPVKREIEIKDTMAKAIVRHAQKTNTILPFWRAAAVFLGVGALLTIGIMRMPYDMPQNPLAKFNPLVYSRALPLEWVESGTEVKSEKSAVIPVVEATPAEDETTAEAEKILPEPVQENHSSSLAVVENNLPYHVIVGSFKDEQNAIELIEGLRKQGYDPKVIRDGSSYTKVSLESFASRQQASMALQAYKLTVNKGAWIYSR